MEDTKAKNIFFVGGGLKKRYAEEKNRGNYYPFGMQMPERGYEGTSYRYGFNGMEKDDEVKGSGNSYDFNFRFYDPRLGKFLCVDPLISVLPWSSAYAFAENDVIRAIDLEGLEKYIVSVLSEETGSVILKITLSSETIQNQTTVHGPQVSFDGGKTYSTNFRYKVLQKYFRQTKFIAGTLYHYTADGKTQRISEYGGASFGHPSGTDAPTLNPPTTFQIDNTRTEPRLIHVNLAPIIKQANHSIVDGPSLTTTNKYNTGKSSTKSLVSVNYQLFGEANTIEVLDSDGNVLKTYTGTGSGTLSLELDANTDFSICVKPSTEGSTSDGWSYNVNIQNTKEEITYDEKGSEPIE